MTDDDVWRRRFQLFAAIRLFGLLTFLLGIAIAYSDLVRPGGRHPCNHRGDRCRACPEDFEEGLGAVG